MHTLLRWLADSFKAPPARVELTMVGRLAGFRSQWVGLLLSGFRELCIGRLVDVFDDHIELETFDGRPLLLRIDPGASNVRTATPLADQAQCHLEAVRQRGGAVGTLHPGTETVQ